MLIAAPRQALALVMYGLVPLPTTSLESADMFDVLVIDMIREIVAKPLLYI